MMKKKFFILIFFPLFLALSFVLLSTSTEAACDGEGSSAYWCSYLGCDYYTSCLVSGIYTCNSPSAVCCYGTCTPPPVTTITTTIPSCTDDCGPVWSTRCADSSTIEICGNHDADSCLEWGYWSTCNPGTVCSGGSCIPTSTTTSTTTSI